MGHPTTFDLWFTQYLMPDGRPVKVKTRVALGLRDKAELIVAAGFKFEIEMLQTGAISITIGDGLLDSGDYAHEVCANGPPVVTAIEKMISEFDINHARALRQRTFELEGDDEPDI